MFRERFGTCKAVIAVDSRMLLALRPGAFESDLPNESFPNSCLCCIVRESVRYLGQLRFEERIVISPMR